MLIVDGVRLPGHFQPELVERARQYHQAVDDILVVSYPKAGTHWLCHILSVVLADFGVPEPPTYLEAAGDDGQLYNSDQHRRIVFSHLPVGFFVGDEPNSSVPVRDRSCRPAHVTELHDEAKTFSKTRVNSRRLHKVIYLCRNPADVIVSYHYHCQTLASLYGDGVACQSLEEFSDSFLRNECYYGSYFSHVKDWLSYTGCDLHVVAYEQLQLQFDSTVRELLRFIGRERWLDEGDTQQKLDRLREECTVSRTRRLIQRQVADVVRKTIDNGHLSQDQRHSVNCIQTEESDRDKFVSVFAHNGLIGEGQAKLSAKTLTKLQELTSATFSDTTIGLIWKKLGILEL